VLQTQSGVHSQFTFPRVGRDSSVGTATRYGLEGAGIESGGRGRISAFVQTGLGVHPASYTMGTGSCPVVNLQFSVTAFTNLFNLILIL
jgi:hypothetical protein